MDMLVFKFGLGLLILLFSTQKLVKLAEKISQASRISPLIIGLTIVALGTSLPELVVSTISVLKNDVGLALGNIIGSNIVNILMVLPVGIFIGKLRIGTIKTQRNALVLLGVTALFLLSQIIGFPKPALGILLLGLAAAISIAEYRLGILGRSHEDSGQFKSAKKTKLGLGEMTIGLSLILAIIAGGLLIVDSIGAISVLTGVSTTILGLTLTAIATSLPELLTTIYSQEAHQDKITIGSIMGSNIYNLLLIGGIVMLFPSNITIPLKNWAWLAFATLGFVFILRHYRGQRPPKWVGVTLLLFFFAYLFSQ